MQAQVSGCAVIHLCENATPKISACRSIARFSVLLILQCTLWRVSLLHTIAGRGQRRGI
jgi:hypothetical protein